MADTRSKVIALMRVAIRAGKSRTAFLRDMKTKGFMYTQRIMKSDWAGISELIAKDGALIHVRRDSYPASKTLVETDWDINGEYMYKVKVTSRLSPTDKLTERFVNIVTDSPMTPAMVEQAIVEKWSDYEDYSAETIETITPWTAIHTNI